ncbi:MAG: hypothetical protein AB7L65_09820 [Hyphomonadaceae bacterium]
MPPDITVFFRAYADLYNEALSVAPDYEAIAGCFAKCFIAAGPKGVSCEANDEAFRQALRDGFDFYRLIGARRLDFNRLEETRIDADHVMARVFYSARYVRPGGAQVVIDFSVVYLIAAEADAWKIFAYIAGDEMALYREAGLLENVSVPPSLQN